MWELELGVGYLGVGDFWLGGWGVGELGVGIGGVLGVGIGGVLGVGIGGELGVGDPGVRWAACWGCQEEVKEGVSCCWSVLSGGLARRCGGGVGGGGARESKFADCSCVQRNVGSRSV
jgi:hypothetical protein